MLSWILAALIGAVPLYFGFAFGRGRKGLIVVTAMGGLLSLVVLGLVAATSLGTPTGALLALGVSYIAAVGAVGMLAGALAGLVFDRAS